MSQPWNGQGAGPLLQLRLWAKQSAPAEVVLTLVAGLALSGVLVWALLPAGHAVREVPMFGGLSVLLDERMVVAVRRNDSLLVRVDPARSAELLGVDGAEPAAMGAHRSMGPGWIAVSSAAFISAPPAPGSSGRLRLAPSPAPCPVSSA